MPAFVLATYRCNPRCLVKVLNEKITSSASDVYSFGVVVWEVLSRELPWEDESLQHMIVRVMVKKDRLDIPADSPPDVSNVLNACWDYVPSNRPTFQDIMNSLG